MAGEVSFIHLLMQEQSSLLAYLLSAVGEIHAAEDLLQTVASVLWEKHSEYDSTRPFGAWAFGIARLEVLKWRQQAARSREVFSEESIHLLCETAAEQAPELDDRYYHLADCIKYLGGLARRSLEMKYQQGWKISEIAEHLNRQVAAVEMILVRSRRELRQCIERKMAQAHREAP